VPIVNDDLHAKTATLEGSELLLIATCKHALVMDKFCLLSVFRFLDSLSSFAAIVLLSLTLGYIVRVANPYIHFMYC
jgi:hypothetical protein